MTNTLAALIVLRFKGHSQSSDALMASIKESCVGMSMEYDFELVTSSTTDSGFHAYVEVLQSPSGRPLTLKRLYSLRDELATDVGCNVASANLLKGGA
jgi:hypothetical protein